MSVSIVAFRRPYRYRALKRRGLYNTSERAKEYLDSLFRALPGNDAGGHLNPSFHNDGTDTVYFEGGLTGFHRELLARNGILIEPFGQRRGGGSALGRRGYERS